VLREHQEHAVKVMIGGEEYTVRSDLPPEYTREVAAYVDQALKKSCRRTDRRTHKAAILAALDITNELFQAKKGEREVAARLAALADDLTKLLPAGSVKPSAVIRPPSSGRQWGFSDRRHSPRLRRGDAGDRSYGGLLAVVSALLGGGVAAGVLAYVVGRRVERRTAELAARTAAVETERLLGEARQRVVLAGRKS